MSFIFYTLISAIFYTNAYAEFVNPSNAPNALSNVVNALVMSSKSTGVKDTISGKCEFKGSSCNGAVLTLLKNDETIYTMTLTANGEFIIPNLKQNQSYLLILSWPKYSLNKKIDVNVGEFLNVQLDK